MEPNTKLIVLTVVLALTLTAATGQTICGMTYDDMKSCQPYVQTTNPLTTPIDPLGPCCTSMTKADVPCLCKYRNNPFVRGVDFDRAAKLPEKCGKPPVTC